MDLVVRLFVILATLFSVHGQSEENTLKSVQLVFRHGKKEADNAFGVRTGLLTNEGKEEMYQLGKFMRSRYKDFIKEEYDPTEIEILSSAANRCVQSGALFAYGLYEDYNQRANWSSKGNIPYEPIPVQTIPAKYDKYLQLTAECPRHAVLKAEFEDTVGEEIFTQFQDIISAYIQATGDTTPLNASIPWINRLFVLAPLIDTNSIANLETAPDWVKPFLQIDIYNTFKRIYNYNLYYSSSKELKALEVGPLYEMLYKRMNLNQPGLKNMYVYPTHDFSLGALQSLFAPNIDAFPPDPPTGSTFIIEVHQDSREGSEAYLEIYFSNDTTTEPWKMSQIPGCPEICYVKQFGNIIKDFIPQNYAELCKIEQDSSSYTTNVIWIGLFVLVIGITIACVVTSIVNFCRRRKNYSRV